MRLRVLAAFVLLVISVGTSVSTFLLWSDSQDALRRAQDAQVRGRALRKLTDLHFCRAINESRAINNRDRKTLLRAQEQTKAALRVVVDPVLKSLLVKGVRQNAVNISDRPFLKPLPCVAVIQHPSGKLPPPLTTSTSS